MNIKKRLNEKIVLSFTEQNTDNIVYLQNCSPIRFTPNVDTAMNISTGMVSLIKEVVKKEFPTLECNGIIKVETVQYQTYLKEGV